MPMFRDFAEHKNIMASRSTNVTFARSIDMVFPEADSSASRRSTSGRYSFVNCPQRRTLKDFSFSRVGLIFNTVLDFLTYTVLHVQDHKRISRTPPELMFIDLQRFNPRFERRCGKTEPRCSAIRTRYA